MLINFLFVKVILEVVKKHSSSTINFILLFYTFWTFDFKTWEILVKRNLISMQTKAIKDYLTNLINLFDVTKRVDKFFQNLIADLRSKLVWVSVLDNTEQN